MKKAKAIDAAVESIRKEITDATAPLGKRDYLSVLEEISCDLDGMIEATEQELKEEDE